MTSLHAPQSPSRGFGSHRSKPKLLCELSISTITLYKLWWTLLSANQPALCLVSNLLSNLQESTHARNIFEFHGILCTSHVLLIVFWWAPRWGFPDSFRVALCVLLVFFWWCVTDGTTVLPAPTNPQVNVCISSSGFHSKNDFSFITTRIHLHHFLIPLMARFLGILAHLWHVGPNNNCEITEALYQDKCESCDVSKHTFVSGLTIRFLGRSFGETELQVGLYRTPGRSTGAWCFEQW